MFNLAGMATGMTKIAGPRGGKRREWGTNLVFDWQATDRLKISAGIRYHNFRGFDTALAEGRARRDPRYQAGGGDSSTYSDGVYIPYFELVGDRERRDWDAVSEQSRRAYQSGDDAAIAAADRAVQAHGARYKAARNITTVRNIRCTTSINISAATGLLMATVQVIMILKIIRCTGCAPYTCRL